MGGVIDQLHQLERKILPLLAKQHSFTDIVKESGLKEVEASRAVQWLQNKELVKVQEAGKEFIILDKNGVIYLRDGLPERKVLNALKQAKGISLHELAGKAKIDKSEIAISLGVLKKRAAIDVTKGTVSLTVPGRQLADKDLLEEKFLRRKFPCTQNDLSPEDKFAYNELIKRKQIIKKDVLKNKTITLTEAGEELLKHNLDASGMLEAVTIDIIKNRAWKDQQFRAYDVKTNVPKITYGKVHFEQQAVESVKKVFLEMGFTEMRGNIVQTAFWNMDALFVPQDHPAREMQDTFYLKNPERGKLPKDVVKKVKDAHERGGDTGSTGWGGEWKEEIAEQLLLRTHDTVLSAHKLVELKGKPLPIKVFNISKVFRNENPDWKHLFELYQVGGFVVDERANFCQLIFYLKQFFKKMGYDDIKIKPSFFPFTEPSIEVLGFNKEKKQWVELAGAGIFRPELVKPLLGKDVPVLAWGLGLARIIAPYYGITDIRDLYRNDIKQLREIKAWLQC
ncbi:MAG: phenylalanine--tRNA ligase subunit alpha [archaeon]